jgi:hypothetical protein
VSAGRRDAAILAAGIALYVGLAVGGMRRKAAAFDEVAYLPAGYTHWKLRDFRLSPEQPPLVKLLAAAPLLAGEVTLHQDDGWARRRQWDFGHNLLYVWNDADRLLFRARLPVVALGAALAAAVYWWTRLHWGAAAAALALLLCALSPETLAHGQLVTMDLGVALFIFLCVVAFERVTQALTASRVAAAGAALGAALATKSSAFVLGPILLALALRRALAGEPLPRSLGSGRSSPLQTRLARAAHLAASLAAMALLALLVLWTAHLWEPRVSPDPSVEAALDWEANWPANRLAAGAASLARDSGLLPEAYLFGVLKVFAHAEGRPAFLMGERSQHGFWSYYPTSMALKTPLALFVLLAAAWVTRGSHRAPARVEWYLFLPPLVYLVLAAARPINIGHRYVLPVYPFLFVAAGRAAAWAAGAAARRPAARVLVASLAAWYSVSVLRVHPHYLAYFNELAGGPANGYRYLVDSSLDWGQDLKELARWQRELRIGRIKLAYFGTADPAYHGIDCERLPGYTAPPPRHVTRRVNEGDVVAVSATVLQGLYVEEDMLPLFEKLRTLRPIAVLAHTIFVYRVDFGWEPARRGGEAER